MAERRWMSETLFEEIGLRTSYAADRVLFEDATEHQHMVLFENQTFGKMLMLDGATQVTTRDEFVYHEMMTHVPILAHGAVRDVLIVGGGDCGIAEEVLKHERVARVVQVEIDAAVVEFSKTHFPEFTGPVLDNPRFELVIADGMDFVATTERRFDVIIVDSTDPQGPGAVLFTREFYAGCKRCLTDGGVLVTQNGVPFFQPEEVAGSVAHFRSLFAEGTCYVAAIPTYVGGHMAMGFATDDRALRRTPVETLERRYAEAGRFPTRYWTPEVQAAAFALPRFIADALVEAGAGAGAGGSGSKKP
ncbi:polyamine aminopropyltransferase [Rhodovulum sp. PH10]|uniref:polyamine aminopropyltransferase n=1 Tax=Rhodovulum sp. PH10 TaxID=1187851 RepID=UPI00058E9100|nr:polyamine aminopropyltransferase [Rhodovulum sp. PH10]